LVRVIAGKYRSRLLKSLKGMALRPSSDRLRETLFNVLGERVVGSRFVDIFAGTGAVGIEALSRGAVEVVFIERYAPVAALIRKNLEALGVREGARVLPVDALKGLEILVKDHPTSKELPHAVFLDPPYSNAEDYHRVLSFLGSATLLEEGGLVIAEHRRNFELPETVRDLLRVRVLRQGDATLTFYRFLKRDPGSGVAEE
jgi:16S rRNA (guanine966-N2)-methyltransferase